ncbi:MAG: type II secretion system F family protein [archaeon]
MVYRQIAKVYPAKFREWVKEQIIITELKVDADVFVGFVLAFGLGLAFALAFDLYVFMQTPLYVVFPIAYVLSQVAVFGRLMLSADGKRKFVESVLPEALQMMATNIKSGLTTDRALLMSARPEFGVLAKEIRAVGKEVVMGKALEEALIDMTKKIRSDIFDRTISLIVEGMKSGGKLAELLEQTAKDLQDQQILQKEIAANVGTYALFIFIAAAVGAPLLFGMSSFIVQVLTNQMSMATPTSGVPVFGSTAMASSGPKLDYMFVVYFSVTLITIIGAFAGMMMGIIKEGKEKAGLKYAPIILSIALSLFYAVRVVMTSSFGQLLGAK